MRLILSKSHSAYHNLATEEYLLKNTRDDIFYLYINAPSIIVGRKQNTLSEINISYVTENKIPVVRRMSGGGAVFHDLGNLNFCFIIRNIEGIEAGFEKYTAPILEVLHEMGINAVLDGRNDLCIEGRKFSGNAKYLSEKSLLQHGTLLFTSALSDLSLALNPDKQKFTDKAVKSVASRVTNITEHLSVAIDLETFTQRIIEHILATFHQTEFYDLSAGDIASIEQLVTDKYSTWEWNYGSSPAYDYSKTIRTEGGTLTVSLIVKKGVIVKLNFTGDFFSKADVDDYEALFCKCPHNMECVKLLLEEFPPDNVFINIFSSDILKAMF
ncbi:MAG: lipoate--protein ligase [Candidatus Cloacimonetes bacterium]|nr:lipoate--protein ligase [Candidatus Cloacimonadota bacterium]